MGVPPKVDKSGKLLRNQWKGDHLATDMAIAAPYLTGGNCHLLHVLLAWFSGLYCTVLYIKCTMYSADFVQSFFSFLLSARLQLSPTYSCSPKIKSPQTLLFTRHYLPTFILSVSICNIHPCSSISFSWCGSVKLYCTPLYNCTTWHQE
jgi:hypothetical protein